MSVGLDGELPVGQSARRDIEESWRRCEEWQVDDENALPVYLGTTEASARLIDAASPVLDELGSAMRGSRTGVFLVDDEVQILDVRCEDPQYCRLIDENRGLPGYSWAEDLLGTTALALSVRLRKPISVSGTEHYVKRLGSLTAAAAPIVDPLTHQFLGAINLGCHVRDGSHHMLPAAAQAARAVEQRLYEDAGESERLLLARFLSETDHGSAEAVFVFNDRMVLSNAAATSLLRSLDRGALWDEATRAVASNGGGATTRLTLLDGRSIAVRLDSIGPTASRTRVLARVLSDAGRVDVRRRSSHGRRVRPYAPRGIPGSRPTATGGLLIVGEAGTGKLAAAEKLHQQSGRERLMVVEGRSDLVIGAKLLRELWTASSEHGVTLIVRDVDLLSPVSLTALRRFLSTPVTSARAIGTVTVERGAVEPSALADLFPDRLHLPPLRHRLEALPEIVASMMERHGAAGRMQPAALNALSHHDWPGNLRELDALIRAVVASRRTCDITLRDLPQRFRAFDGQRRLTRMEEIECAAIRQALIQADGNRTRAAAILEIGRSTLYRKITAYGLEDPEREVA
jgi:sigma-54 dependent transcriptional regulator, acetoin dehydrogenase operon transcriptional activator AcoR